MSILYKNVRNVRLVLFTKIIYGYCQILGSESFTRWLRHEIMRAWKCKRARKQCFSIITASECKNSNKFLYNFKYPLNRTTQTALPRRQNNICKSFPLFPNVEAKRQKQPLRLTTNRGQQVQNRFIFTPHGWFIIEDLRYCCTYNKFHFYCFLYFNSHKMCTRFFPNC